MFCLLGGEGGKHHLKAELCFNPRTGWGLKPGNYPFRFFWDFSLWRNKEGARIYRTSSNREEDRNIRSWQQFRGNQALQVNEFSVFLCMWRCKWLGSLNDAFDHSFDVFLRDLGLQWWLSGKNNNNNNNNLPTTQKYQVPVWFLGGEDPLKKEMTTHSCILTWRIPWTEESGMLQSIGSQRVRCNWLTNISFHSMGINDRMSLCVLKKENVYNQTDTLVDLILDQSPS